MYLLTFKLIPQLLFPMRGVPCLDEYLTEASLQACDGVTSSRTMHRCLASDVNEVVISCRLMQEAHLVKACITMYRTSGNTSTCRGVGPVVD
jgi:hypothetical protein